MTDTEMLSLIEHYRWSVMPQCNGGWVIETDDGADDPEVVELARMRGSLRDAVKQAMRSQAERATGIPTRPAGDGDAARTEG